MQSKEAKIRYELDCFLTTGPPKIQMPAVIETETGKDLVLHCVAVGDPKPTTTWFPPVSYEYNVFPTIPFIAVGDLRPTIT